MRHKDETGIKYHLLTGIKLVSIDKGRNAKWLFKCDCGNQTVTRACNVRTGIIKSCGCLHGFHDGKRQPLYGTKFYRTFHLMKQRCLNKKHPRYYSYGGRGIKCLWNSFSEFEQDMYASFVAHNAIHGGRNTSIDRIDVDGNYCKENCRWATAKEQCNNTRSNLTYKRRCGQVTS